MLVLLSVKEKSHCIYYTRHNNQNNDSLCCQEWMQSWVTNLHTPCNQSCDGRPFTSPLFFTMTAALSSKHSNAPSFLQYDLHCPITTAACPFFLSCGDHHHVAHTTAGSLFSHPFEGLNHYPFEWFLVTLGKLLFSVIRAQVNLVLTDFILKSYK